MSCERDKEMLFMGLFLMLVSMIAYISKDDVTLVVATTIITVILIIVFISVLVGIMVYALIKANKKQYSKDKEDVSCMGSGYPYSLDGDITPITKSKYEKHKYQE